MANKYVTIVLSPDNINSNSDYFDIYSDFDNYSTPIAQNITLNELTARTTPFNILVPKTALQVMVFDVANNIETYTTINENNLCITSDLGFDIFEQETVGRIIAGNLTALTQSQITDYKVNWYGPDSTTNLAFTTGKGVRYQYQYQHPLINNSALFASAGYYRPVIDKVWLSDIEILGEKCDFSQTGNTQYSNNPVPALLTCFDDVLVGVSAFTCDNGNSSDLPQYEHRVKFTSTGNGVVPQPLSATFKLDTTTKYFAWRFTGEAIPDQLKLIFIGSAYSQPIVLEYWQLGGNFSFFPFIFQPNDFPKIYDSYTFFNKVTCLTGLTINSGDTIEMQVTPNTSNTSTNWDFYFTCINRDFDCSFCEKYPRRIILSSITLNNISTCSQSFNFKFENKTDCDAINSNNDLSKYVGIEFYDSTYNIFNKQSLVCGQSTTTQGPQSVCATPQPYTIKYEKTIGNFKTTTNNIIYINTWYQEYIYWKNLYGNTPNINDPTKIEYYRSFIINIPTAQGLTDCGDGTIPYNFNIHISSVVTTGQTGSDYWINFTMPTMVFNYTVPTSSCSRNCTDFLYKRFISTINDYSSNINNNKTIITNRGSRYLKMAWGFELITENLQAQSTTYSISSSANIFAYNNETYPASGSPLTLIPSLSAKTCENFNNKFYSSQTYDKSITNTNYMTRLNGYYIIELIDFDTKQYKFYANTTINSGTTYPTPINLEHILTYNNGVKTVINPAYFV